MESKNKIVQNSLIICAFFLITFFSVSAQAATHYVSSSGSWTWAQSTNINTPCSVTTAEINADDDDIVYFRGGTYSSETLAPSHSGSSGHSITFKAYTGETPTLDGENLIGNAIALAGRSYITIDGFTIRRYTGYSINIDDAGTYAYDQIIQNCTIQENGKPNAQDPEAALGGGALFATSTDGFQFLNNTVDFSVESGRGLGGVVIYGYRYDADQAQNSIIKGNTIIGSGAGNADDAICIHVSDYDPYRSPGNRHLIEDNLIYNWSENCIDLASEATHIVVRGNTLHSAGWQVITGANDYYRIVDNIIYDGRWSGSEHMYMTSMPNGPMQILRNVFYGNGNGLMAQGYSATTKIVGFYVFHNTFDATSISWGQDHNILYLRDSDTYLENYNAKNNIFYYDSADVGIKFLGITQSNHKFDYNLYYNTASSPGANIWYHAGSRTLSYVQSNYEQEAHAVESNPLFQNVGSRDYTLQSGSSAINAGGWLTTITSATGSGTTFTVDDPNWFYDGWSITGETGDVIETENGQSATITSINYTTGAITVSSSISWTNGEGIGLDYKDIRPDIGAKEYSLYNGSLSSPKGLTILPN